MSTAAAYPLSIAPQGPKISCYAVAAALHAVLIFMSGHVLGESAKFGVRAGGAAVEVALVAHMPAAPDPAPPAEPMTAPEPPPPAESEFVKPAPVKKKVSEKKPQPVRAPQPAAAQSSTAAAAPAGEAGSSEAGAISAAMPDFLRNPPPAYPASSRRAGEEGLVLLRVDIDDKGRVTALDVRKSSGFQRLDEAAVRAVRKWIFKPARIGGIARADRVEVPIRFKLENRA